MDTKLKTRLSSLMVGLLFGNSGLSKTFTAEAIAELAQLPLMMVPASSLGSEPQKIEHNLATTLGRQQVSKQYVGTKAVPK